MARVDDDSDASRSRATRPSVDVGGAGVSGAGDAVAASLRATAGYGNEPPRGFATANEVRAASGFVFGLIARSVAMDAERRFDRSEIGDGSDIGTAFRARPGGSSAPTRDDPRFATIRRLVDFASSDVCDATSSGDETRARLARGLNLGVARLCSALMDVEGPPEDAVLGLHPGGSSNAPDATPKKTRMRGVRVSTGTRGARAADETNVDANARSGFAGPGPAAPFAALARDVAAAHLRRLVASEDSTTIFAFYGAVASAPAFVSTAAAATRGAGWHPDDLATEDLVAAEDEPPDANATGSSASGDESTALVSGDAFSSKTEHILGDALTSAMASATMSGLLSSDRERREAAARALRRALARHAWDARLQSREGRAAVAARVRGDASSACSPAARYRPRVGFRFAPRCLRRRARARSRRGSDELVVVVGVARARRDGNHADASASPDVFYSSFATRRRRSNTETP